MSYYSRVAGTLTFDSTIESGLPSEMKEWAEKLREVGAEVKFPESEDFNARLFMDTFTQLGGSPHILSYVGSGAVIVSGELNHLKLFHLDCIRLAILKHGGQNIKGHLFSYGEHYLDLKKYVFTDESVEEIVMKVTVLNPKTLTVDEDIMKI